MTCEACGHENPADANFCGQCGSPLPKEQACPECGKPNAPDLSYCRSCGFDLRASPAPAPENGQSNGDAPTRIAGGRYVIQSYLGEGGRKRVYLAHDTMLDRDVAVALVKTRGLDESGRIRIRREARAMARLGDHPHVVTVYDIGEDQGEPFIVSQYMAGGALEGLLEQADDRRLDIPTATRIADGVCQALGHAHGNGIIHRDLKPANVWLAADGTAKLGDFGLAFSLERSRVTKRGAIVGTVAYMAPEQALSHQPDAASDLYSLGAMLYEMITGRPPFVGDDVVSVISQHQNAEPVAPSWHVPDVPEALEELILELLAKNPDERPASAKAVSERLAKIELAPRAQTISRPSSEANRVASLAEGVFVGREREFDKLRSAFDDSVAGRGSFVVLVGEPGIGKTRTAQELGTYARLRGARVLVGRAYEGEGAPAYWPWVQMARQYIQDRDMKAVAEEMGPGAADIATVMSELREMIPGITEQRPLEPEQARFRFFDSITTWLKNAAAAQPLVMIVDDLHWADAPSLLMLKFLAREVADSNILLLGTYRDVELGRRHPLSQTLAEISRDGLVDRILLRGLSEHEVGRYIEVTANVKAPRSLVKAVHEETEGNPFFVSEVVNLLASEGALHEKSELDHWTLTIPQGVREVVGRRLDLLSPECNELLAIASVIGREFGVEVLELVAELERDRVLELLEEADGQRIVSQQPGPVLRFSFSHALVRDALYEELGVTRRVRLHRRTAEMIEELCGEDREPHLVELARHFLEAQQLDQAIEYSTAAADRAFGVMAYEEAANLYAQALQAHEVQAPAATRRRCELMLALGRAQARAGDPGGAHTSFERAAVLARELEDACLLAEAADGRAQWLEVGTVEDNVIALLEESLARLPVQDSAVRAKLLSRLAIAVHFRSIDERKKFALEAIPMARRVGDPQTLAAVLNNCQFALRGPDNLEERVAVDRELIVAAERAGDKELAVEGRGLLITDLLETGDIDAVQREMEIYARGAMTLRQPSYIRYALIRRAMLGTLAGRFDEVDALLDELGGSGLTRYPLDPNTVQGVAIAAFWLRRHRGELEAIGAQLERFTDQYPAVPGWRAALAVAWVNRGDHEEARRELDRLWGPDGTILPRDANWLIGMTLAAEVCAAIGDRRRGRWIYGVLAPYADRVVVVGPGWGCHGSVARFLGMLSSTLGRFDEAERHFQQAMALNTKLGARPFVALTSHNYAQMLVARGGPGDAVRANRLVGDALATAEELGMNTLIEQALALRVSIQGIGSADTRASIDAVAAEVEEERPDLRGHTAPDGTVTILFSDIERSTELNERLGDRRFIDLLREHNELVRENVRAHGGFEVKSQGDGFMIAFSSARRALECAVAIQRALAARNGGESGEPIRVRMGLHTGEAIRERDDFFGRNVVVAARIAAQARGGEILVSSLLKDVAGGAGEISFGEVREVELKGLSGTHGVHEVEWEPAPASAGA